MRTAFGLCAFVAIVGFAAGVRAQSGPAPEPPALGAPGHLALSLERLFGVDHVSETETMNGATIQTYSSTSISVLRQPQFAGTLPRAAADFFLTHRLSLGAAFGFSHGTETFNPTGGTSMTENLTSLVLAPRVGYVLRLAPWLSAWPRAGLTWAWTTGDIPYASGGQASVSSQALLATVDVPLAVTIVPRAAFTLAPTFDVTLVAESGSLHSQVLEIGLMAGLAVVL